MNWFHHSSLAFKDHRLKVHLYISAARDGHCSLFASDAFKVFDPVTIRRFVSFEFAHLHMKNADVQARNPFQTGFPLQEGPQGCWALHFALNWFSQFISVQLWEVIAAVNQWRECMSGISTSRWHIHTYKPRLPAYTRVLVYCVGGYSTFGVCACVCMCVCVCLTMWLWVCTVTLKYYVMVFGAELITPLASLANRCINKQATGGSQRELIHHLPCHCFHYSHISFENPLNMLDTLLPISSYLSKLFKNEWNLKSILSVSS